jgi:3-methylcrotonyl-CoA carboxylase alpha subunit
LFSAVLVANRGEIAVRVITTLRRLGIRAIAVCSQADADAPHVRLADEALTIGPAPAAESYLRIDRIVDAALRSGAQAVHPGYGLLSERAQFARACADAGLVFVGPPPAAIELLGDKARAKALADDAGVATLPGIARSGLGLRDDEIVAWAQEEPDRLPLLVKAAAGGGGRGMRVVATLDELAPALHAARREALASFGDDALLVERYVERARHVEVQLLADAHGTIVHLGERECSLQRRHQKLFEESPSPAIGDDVRASMAAAAVAIARAAGYAGAGTCEFLVPAADPQAFWFLELNARLQVEHPVTELVCGLDLVEAQLRVAAGEPLWLTQEQIVVRGHAIEARVCAEGAGFLPQTGRIVAYREPAGPGIRVDSGVCAGSDVSGHYDSLLTKVVAHAPTRELALERLDAALAELVILGPQVNTAFLRGLLADPRVRAGELDTGLVERLARDGAAGAPTPLARDGVAGASTSPARDGTGVAKRLARDRAAGAFSADEDAAAAAALARTAALRASASDDPWERLLGWRADGPAPMRWRLRGGRDVFGADAVDVLVGHDEVQVAGGRPRAARVEIVAPDRLAITLGGARRVWAIAQDGDVTRLGLDGHAWGFADEAAELRAGADDAGSSLSAPMPGSVLVVHAHAGESVAAGDVLVVLESMKMELQVVAPAAGTVERVAVAAGERVASGQLLVELGAAADA